MSVKLHRRLIIPTAVAAVIGLALTGCGNGPGATTAESGAAGDGEVTVYGTIWQKWQSR